MALDAVGRGLLPLAALAALAAIVGYGWVHRLEQRHEGRHPARWAAGLRLARFALHLHAGFVLVAAALLMNAVLTHRFDLDYVFGHSSTDLPPLFLLSTFWAGQEGSLLLWATYGSLLALTLAARSRDWEASVMVVFCTLQLLVIGLLLVRSPFNPLVLDRFAPGDLALIQGRFGGIPPQGAGLNPLLQNPWMAIHPPLLFLGFASMAVPFSFALAGLLRRDLDGWTWRAQSWTLLGWVLLGTGLVLGGYWAYETLGWGGYWAWDPVENSSLVPWLFAGALFHGLILQRRQPGVLRRQNLWLAALAFISVTYGSYLNRSGVLSDFSVHSFVSLEPSFNHALLAFAVLPLLGFLAVYLPRWRLARSVPISAEAWARKKLLFGTTVLLGGSGLVVLVGNSWPLISSLLAQVPGLNRWVPAASSLQPSFYNQTHTPLAMVLLGLLAVVMLVGWDSVRRERLITGLKLPLILTAAAAAGIVAGLWVYLGHRAETPDLMPATAGRLAWAWGTLMVLAVLAGAVNGGALVRDWLAGQRRTTGAHLAHLGFSVLILGVVGSSVYETKAVFELPLDQPVLYGGYELTYTGLERRGEVNAEVRILTRPAHHRDAQPILMTPLLRPNRDGLIRNPAILQRLTHDLYLEPGEIQPGEPPEAVLMRPDQPLTVGDVRLEFLGFRVDPEAGLDPTNLRVGVQLRVNRGSEEALVTPVFAIQNGRLAPEAAPLPGGGSVAVIDLPQQSDDAMDRGLLISLSDSGLGGKPETAIVQATLKPLMSVVWLGCWLTLVGGLWAAVRRALEAGQRVLAARRG